jgi:hypothetical protein
MFESRQYDQAIIKPVNGRRELISARTRTAIRNCMSGTVLRDINEMWQDEHPPTQDPEPVGDERTGSALGYNNGLN